MQKLKRTFDGLAAGCPWLPSLLHDLPGAFTRESEEILCDGIVALTSEDPQDHLVGDDLWNELHRQFPAGDDINFLGLVGALEEKLSYIKAMAARCADAAADAEPEETTVVLVG
ncbi:MAG: hypothetical protein WC675_01955 [Patescibacteria group bacterium]|jgi:hypothetical protein